MGLSFELCYEHTIQAWKAGVERSQLRLFKAKERRGYSQRGSSAHNLGVLPRSTAFV
jgi:hypothetical protein